MPVLLNLPGIGELSILSYSWAAETGRGAKEMSIVRTMDDRSSEIFHAATSGKSFDEVVLTYSKEDDTKGTLEYRITLKSVLVGSYDVKGDEESFSLVYYQSLFKGPVPDDGG